MCHTIDKTRETHKNISPRPATLPFYTSPEMQELKCGSLLPALVESRCTQHPSRPRCDGNRFRVVLWPCHSSHMRVSATSGSSRVLKSATSPAECPSPPRKLTARRSPEASHAIHPMELRINKHTISDWESEGGRVVRRCWVAHLACGGRCGERLRGSRWASAAPRSHGAMEGGWGDVKMRLERKKFTG